MHRFKATELDNSTCDKITVTNMTVALSTKCRSQSTTVSYTQGDTAQHLVHSETRLRSSQRENMILAF